MPDHLAMSRRALVPVAEPQSSTPTPVVRRYRLSRVSLLARPDPALDRLSHLRRS